MYQSRSISNTLASTKKIIIDYKVYSYLNWFSFFLAFPVVLILGQNISVFLFLLISFRLRGKIKVFEISNKILFIPMLFGIGAIISVLDLNARSSESLSRSLTVLPNYLYWSFLVIMLVNLKCIINVPRIAEYTMLGVITTVVYYNLQSLFSVFSFVFNPLTPNSFSFILICFSAPCFIYLLNIKKSKFLAFLFLIVSMFFLVSEGRRAGTMLVFLPCLFSFLFSRVELSKMIFGFLFFVFSFTIMQTETAEKLIQSMNPRIYSMLYESENITSEDRSYLVRRLQVEKAGLIFLEHPFTGIGLNNFSNFDVNFKGNFAGAEYVIDKSGMNDKSAHNSYITLLAEGGLLLILPFVSLLFFNVIHFIKKYNFRSQIENAYYWSFCAMCIHLYFITGIVNVYAWFLIGIVTMLTVKYSMVKRLKC